MEKKIKRQKSIYARMKENSKVQSAATIVLPVIFGIFLFCLWQFKVLHKWFHTDTFTLPVPTRINSIIIKNVGKIMVNVEATLMVALIGLLVGSILGYLVALLVANFPKSCKGALNIIGAFASIPVVALAPVMNNWTKDVSENASVRSMVAKILVVMLIAAANMSLNAFRGLTELKPYSEDLMSTYAAGRIKTFIKLRFPNSVPYIFVALKVSVPASLITAIVSEYFAEYITGVGRQIKENIVLSQYSTAWAYIAVTCVIGVTMYMILMLTQKAVLRKYN